MGTIGKNVVEPVGKKLFGSSKKKISGPPAGLSESTTTSKGFQPADLRDNDQCLQQMISLYFKHHGQTKYVAQELGIRRNTVIDAINARMLPYICRVWVEECGGEVARLAVKLKCTNDDDFHKTLRWHQRVEAYLSSIEVDSDNRISIAKALHFLRNIQEPLTPVAPPADDATVADRELLYRPNPGTDNMESIARKITKLKTLKFGTMMILGETGAGKGWLGKQIYHYLYPNEEKPYIHINCAHLISAAVELFGSVRGAFTDAVNKPGAFEMVSKGGVVFLDEIDALPMDVQMKLLLVLGEDGVFYRVGSTKPLTLSRFTLITATNQDLEIMAQRGQFRWDLLGRINQPCIRLKTWSQQPLQVKYVIIKELKAHIIENDFETPYSQLLSQEFRLTPEHLEVLINAQYTFNIRSVRKQITEFMTQFLLDNEKTDLTPFQFQR